MSDSPLVPEIVHRVNCMEAVSLAARYGQIDGDHHKTWVIDQMVRSLLRDDYDNFIRGYNAGGYTWDVGIAP